MSVFVDSGLVVDMPAPVAHLVMSGVLTAWPSPVRLPLGRITVFSLRPAADVGFTGPAAWSRGAEGWTVQVGKDGDVERLPVDQIAGTVRVQDVLPVVTAGDPRPAGARRYVTVAVSGRVEVRDDQGGLVPPFFGDDGQGSWLPPTPGGWLCLLAQHRTVVAR